MNLLIRVLKENKPYVYIHYFQGCDLPIKSQEEIHNFFDKNQGLEFVSVEYERKKMAEGKCLYRHFFCHNRWFRKNKAVKALNFGLVWLQKKMRIHHNTDIALFHGSALFSITSDFAAYLVEHEAEIQRRFRFALAADECFVQTLIMNSPFREKIALNGKGEPFNARLIDRTRPDGKNSPHIWRNEEFRYITAQPEEICFARKFDEKIGFNLVEELMLHCKKE